MQSMTGYGRYRACSDGRELTIELKTVNHRFLDIAFRLPKNLMFLEDSLRSLINRSSLCRGHLDVFVTYQNNRTDAQTVQIDPVLLRAFHHAMKESADLLEDYKRSSVAEVLTLSGALRITQAEEDVEAVTSLASEAFEGALAALTAMREREGQHLKQDLLQNLDEVARIRQCILQRAPQVPLEYRQRLQARLDEWQLGSTDPQRVAQEVAIMADRCAIDEELSRLEGHIAQFTETVQNGREVGRKLDFLIQEMNREINTIGSKASDAEIAQCVVDAKCVVEKLREQVQNAV